MVKTLTFAVLAWILCSLNPLLANEKGDHITRESAPEKYRWNTSAIYPDWAEWENDLALAGEKLNEIVAFQGKLNEGPEQLLALLNINEEAGKILYKLYCYPYLQRSVDTRNQEINSRFQQMLGFYAGFVSQVSWITPEMLTIPEEKLRDWINNDPGYENYRFGIENTLRQQQYVLDQDKEELLSYFMLSTNAPSQIYTELATSDIDFPEITLSSGEQLPATQANLGKTLAFNKNQDDRRMMYEGHLSAFNKNANTFAAILNGVYQGDWAYAKSKKFDNYLQYSLIGDNIPEVVYFNLINTAKENTVPLQRYNELRKQVLNLETYHVYDGSISLSDYSKQYTWEEASQLVYDAVAPLGADYQERVAEMLSGGWIDVYEGESKQTNAYSMGVYGVHPYILMNWDGTMRNVFTLAHELGHSLHSMYSSENQPYATHDYATFVAEVASIFNEELLLDHMLKNSTDPMEKIALLNQAISNLTSTFYRQSLFADFEYQVRSKVESGEAVNLASLKSLMADLNNTYYGESVAYNPLNDMTWARVMHFYELKYYVFQYATSYAASSHLFNQIAQSDGAHKQQALDRYINLLKAGGSDYPINLLNAAGVDMSKPETLKAVVHRLEELVGQLEQELKTAGMI